MDFDLPRAIRDTIATGGEGEALAFDGRWRSWGWLGAVAAAIDRRLDEAGIAPGAPVGLVARNRPPHVAAFAALLAGRRATIMIYAAQSAKGIAADIAALRLPALIADIEDWSPEARDAAAGTGSLRLSLCDTVRGEDVVSAVGGLDRRGAGPFRSDSAGLALELLSSGTTGAPKRIPLSWAAVSSAVASSSGAYAGSASRAAPVIMSHPLGNVAGLAYIAPPLAFGQRVVLLEKFEAAGWAAAVRNYRPVRASLPPAGVRMVLEQGIPRTDLVSLQLVAVGGGKLDVALQDRFEERYGIPVLTAFGATEFGGVVANWTIDVYRALGKIKRGSAGRASSGVALRVVGRESFAPLGPDEIGLLEAQVDRIGPGWIRTNDLASLDAAGFLFLHGRADAAINRGGFKIVPDQVADVLRRHPAVADAAVAGLPDARLGEVPVAAVELVAGAEPIDGEALRAWSRDYLIAYQVPTAIKIVDRLPRNAAMKVPLPEVLALFAPSGS